MYQTISKLYIDKGILYKLLFIYITIDNIRSRRDYFTIYIQNYK